METQPLMSTKNSATHASMASCSYSSSLLHEASGLVYSSPSQSSSSTSLDSPESLMSDEELDRRRELFFDQWLEEDEDNQRTYEVTRTAVSDSPAKASAKPDLRTAPGAPLPDDEAGLGHRHHLLPPTVNICPPTPDILHTPVEDDATSLPDSMPVASLPTSALAIPLSPSPPSCTRIRAGSSKKRVAFASETPPDREDDDVRWAKRFGRCSTQANAQPGKGIFTFELNLSQDDLMRNR